MEGILGQSIRGISGMLRLSGGRAGPPGIELSVPSPSVFDLTQLARYGSGVIGNANDDGWWLFSANDSLAAIGFSNASFDVGGAASSPRKNPNDVFWIYRVGVGLVAIDIADFKGCAVQIAVPAAANFGPSAILKYSIFTGNSGNITLTSANAGIVRPIGTGWATSPVPVSPDMTVDTVLENDGAVGIVTMSVSLLGRFAPPGVPPLP